jgi:Phage P22-like portal protein
MGMDDKLATSDDDIVAEARLRLDLCMSAYDGDRALALEDLRFRNGDQWDATAKRQRDIDGRLYLTVNNLPAIVHQVTNDVRQNKQSIQVHAVSEGADDEIAEIMEGMCRHIEYDSDADAAYDTALESAANIGFGFFRLVTEFNNPLTFDQDMKIKRVRNPFTVYTDPNAQEADASDMRFALITSKIPKQEFLIQYPNATVTAEAIGEGTGGGVANWYGADYVRIAEYYRVEEKRAKLELLTDGSCKLASDKTPLPAGVYPTGKTRDTITRQIGWYKLTASEVLEKTVIPFDWIPLFPVYGDETDIDGDVTRSGLIRNAKDPVRMYNFWITGATEEIAMRTKTPYIGAAGQFEGREDDWTNANNLPMGYLEYNQVDHNGQLAPPPQRQPPADVPSGYIAMAGMARDNIKAVTGIYDASLGNRSNETSGIAIKSRQHQGELANFHLSDNLGRAIRHLGRVMISGFPKIYDTERVMRILGIDGKAQTVTINQQLPQPKEDPKTGAIKTVLNDLTVGKYDVVVSSGPAYNTAREAATDAMLQVGQNWPDIYGIAGDKIIGGMDFPGADKIAERVAKKLGIGDDNEDEQIIQTPKGPIPVNQAGKMIAQLDDTLDKLHSELQDFETGFRKSQLDAETRVKVAEINAQSTHDNTELTGMVQLILARMDPWQAAQAAAVAHASAVASAADPMHPDEPAPIAQGMEQAPAQVQQAETAHEQAMEAQPEPDAGTAPAP